MNGLGSASVCHLIGAETRVVTMAISEGKSRWSREKGDARPRLAESPGATSNPSNAPRSDCNHMVRNPGKGIGRRDNCDPVPVQGSGSTAELERALDRGMRNDRR